MHRLFPPPYIRIFCSLISLSNHIKNNYLHTFTFDVVCSFFHVYFPPFIRHLLLKAEQFYFKLHSYLSTFFYLVPSSCFSYFFYGHGLSFLFLLYNSKQVAKYSIHISFKNQNTSVCFLSPSVFLRIAILFFFTHGQNGRFISASIQPFDCPFLPSPHRSHAREELHKNRSKHLNWCLILVL